jgi:hypothetical protein
MTRRKDAYDHVKSLVEAYELLITTLCWERDRFLKCAEQLSADHDEEKANLVLDRQAEYIREQAIR